MKNLLKAFIIALIVSTVLFAIIGAGIYLIYSYGWKGLSFLFFLGYLGCLILMTYEGYKELRQKGRLTTELEQASKQIETRMEGLSRAELRALSQIDRL